MRFAGKSYYIEQCVRWDKCGMPIYLTGDAAAGPPCFAPIGVVIG
jgi:hypothetical protein